MQTRPAKVVAQIGVGGFGVTCSGLWLPANEEIAQVMLTHNAATVMVVMAVHSITKQVPVV